MRQERHDEQGGRPVSRGVDRFEARKAVVAEPGARLGLLVKVEDVPPQRSAYSDRVQRVPVEPLALHPVVHVKTEPLAELS